MSLAHLASFDETAAALLDAYTHGTPEAMERYYARTWHRRVWKTMREYIQLDLGKRPAAAGDDVPLTIDDARAHVAMENGFASWDALRNDVLRWRDGALMASPPVRVREVAADDRDTVTLLETRSWDEAIALLTTHPGATLDGNGQVTDAVLERLAENATLHTLHLGGSKGVTDAGVRHLAKLPALRVLDLSDTAITDAGMAILGTLPALTRLSLNNTRVTDDGIANLASCTALRRLELMWTRTGDGAIRALAGLPHFRELISGNFVTDAGLDALQAIPAFVTPSADGMPRSDGSGPANELMLRGPFTNAGMASLAALPGLEKLALNNCGVTAAGVAPLSSLPRLFELWCDPDDSWMPHIAALPALRALGAQDTVAGDDGFVALAQSHTLERLWGRRCHNLSDRGFLALSRMPTLRNFAASCKSVSDQALAAFPDFPALRELMPMDVPDTGYRHIGRCTALEVLTLMYCRDTTDAATAHITTLTRLQKYFNSYTTITDRTPALLSTMDSLEDVTFSACNGITDDGVAQLARLPRLRRIEASGRQLTPALASHFPAQVRVRIAP